jgi:acid phosphatase type 7
MGGRRGIACALLAVAIWATSTTAAQAASNMLPNGGFDGAGSGSLAGWKATNATLALAGDGQAGGYAGIATRGTTGSTFSFTRSPRPVLSTTAGSVYQATAWVRAAAGSKKVCLYLREYAGTTTAKAVSSCVLLTQSWQQIAAVSLTTVGTGDSVALVITQSSAAAGDSFEADSASLVTVSGDPVIAAAGDIACDTTDASYNGGAGTSTRCNEMATSDLLLDPVISSVLALGDNQYGCGGFLAFMASFDPTWGRVKSEIHPTTGNHEYQETGGTDCDATGKAGGYYAYFGAAAGDPSGGYYSFDIGALNSNCGVVSCAAGSAQESWLRNDLAADTATCTLAYWHHPRWSSGAHGNNTSVAPLWNDLSAARADLVLVGHDHDYERFAPQSPTGALDTVAGIREFVVGTGGASHTGFPYLQANSQVRNSSTFGILELTLHATSYDWQFVPRPARCSPTTAPAAASDRIRRDHAPGEATVIVTSPD